MQPGNRFHYARSQIADNQDDQRPANHNGEADRGDFIIKEMMKSCTDNCWFSMPRHQPSSPSGLFSGSWRQPAFSGLRNINTLRHVQAHGFTRRAWKDEAVFTLLKRLLLATYTPRSPEPDQEMRDEQRPLSPSEQPGKHVPAAWPDRPMELHRWGGGCCG
jgi:hypothetical protein